MIIDRRSERPVIVYRLVENLGDRKGFRETDRSSRTEYRVWSYEYNRTFKGDVLSVIVTQPKSSDE